MSFLKLFIPACISCSCNALANMFWKFRFNTKPISYKSLADVFELVLSPYIWIGVMFYGVSMLIFFYMLSNFKLSAIMPVTCMTYIFNIVIARLVFKENISITQLVGIGIIILGLLVLSRGDLS